MTQGLQSVRVLLVEDNPADADLIQTQADEEQRVSLSVDVCGTLTEAIDTLRSTLPDVILLDLGLPDSSGIETLEKMVEAVSAVPIIVLTGLDDRALADRCLELGAQDYLVKGWAHNFLGGSIYNTVARATAQKALTEANDNINRMVADSHDAILVLDARHVVLYANKAAGALFGDRVGEGQPFGTVLAGTAAQELDVPRADGTTATVEMRIGESSWYGQPAQVVSFRDVTVRNDAQARLEHLTQVLKAIRNVNQLIVREKDPATLIQETCELLIETRGYNGAWIALGHPEDSPSLHAQAGWGERFEALARQLDEGSWPDCRDSAASASDGFALLDPKEACQGCPLGGEYDHDLAAVVALRHDGCDLGTLGVSFPHDVALDEEENSLLLEVAGDIAFALHDIEIEQERREALRQTESLLRATQVVLDKPDFPSAARAIFDVCAEHIGAPAGYCALLSEDGERNEVLFLESGGLPCAVDPQLPMPIRGLRAEAYQRGRAVFDNDFRSSSYWKLMPDGHADLDSVLFAPLVLSDESVGLLGLANKPGGFDERDARMAGAFAEIIAIALRHHRTRCELEVSEEKHRTLFDSSADALMTLEPPTWRFTAGNAAAVELFGATDEADLVSRPPWEYSPAEQPDGRPSADKAKEMIETAMREGSHGFEWQHQRLDGQDFPATVLLTRMKVQDKTILQATVRDITEYRNLQTQIAQSDRLASMGMLAAGVAHEINNPLSYVLYNLESLTEDLPGLVGVVRELQHRLGASEDTDEADTASTGQTRSTSPVMLDDMLDRLKDALSGTHRIRDIARGLGTFSRVERSQVAPVNIMHVIEAAINMGYNEIKYRARLVKDYGKTPTILASEGRLSQVFLNLIINATHAIDEGDVENNQIRVRTWSEGDDVLAEVRDTGHGIPAENIDKLFEPFFSTKEIGTGSGLGLAISKNIVENYGGTITVQSEVGVGTAFTIRLPVRTEAAEFAEVAPEADTQTTVKGRILIVDDEAGIRSAMVRMLKGHTTVEAANGEEARSILENDQAFDLILCDMMMPAISGMDLHQWLADAHPELAKQLIFITGGAFTPRAREYLKKVENLRLEKPFDVANFRKIVGNMIREVKTRTE